jgi:predicted small secreted protein
MMRRLLLGLVVVLGLASLTACRQGQGERCQVTSDCEDGLLCVLPQGGTPQAGGTCQPSGGGEDAAVTDPDLSTTPDLSGTDA